MGGLESLFTVNGRAKENLDGQQRMESIVVEHHDVLVKAAKALKNEARFSLMTPCVLVTPVEAKVIAASSVGHFLKVDSFVDSPLILELLELAKMTSPERALEAMLNSDDEKKAERFAEEYDLFREGVRDRGHADISAGDLASFLVKIRRAFEATPQEVALIAQVRRDDGKVGMMTGCASVDSLLI